jgi:dienelactone hydrolase
MSSPLRRAVLAAVLVTALAGCMSYTEPSTEESAAPSTLTTTVPAPGPTTGSTTGSTTEPSPTVDPEESILTMTPPDPVSLPALAQEEHVGRGLRLGLVRERTAAYTSYDMTYRSDELRISGVLNVPVGTGPFPAVVLAHGYIDPSYYVRGQGMTRERGYLAERGYVALHVDYRNHAESGADPSSERNADLGYAVDVVNAVEALRRSDAVPIADDRVALMGGSMGGAVVHNALVIRPGLVLAASAWSSNSTLETEVLEQWGSPEDPSVVAHLLRPDHRAGADRPWRPRRTCPPRWARATYRALINGGQPDVSHATFDFKYLKFLAW